VTVTVTVASPRQRYRSDEAGESPLECGNASLARPITAPAEMSEEALERVRDLVETDGQKCRAQRLPCEHEYSPWLLDDALIQLARAPSGGAAQARRAGLAFVRRSGGKRLRGW
jgi:hypothetical protein